MVTRKIALKENSTKLPTEYIHIMMLVVVVKRNRLITIELIRSLNFLNSEQMII